MTVWLWAIVVLLAGLSCLFAACSHALRTYNSIRLANELAHRRRGEQLQQVIDRSTRLILSTATLRMLFNIALILVLALVLNWRSQAEWWPFLLTTGLAAFAVVLVFSVAIPNAWATYAGERLLALMLPTLVLLDRLLRPITWLLHLLDELVRRLTGAARTGEESEFAQQEILSAVSAGEREGVVDPQGKRMIESVLEFRETRADQIMTPRTDIIAVDGAADLPAVLATIRRAGHSRIPVYEGSLDNIIGLLYTKDLLWAIGQSLANPPAGDVSADHPHVQPDGSDAPFASAPPGHVDIRQVMRSPLFVPESRSIGDLFNDLRRAKVHLAIVLDEFGGTAGLVTVEDILEEIVGEIADEHEQAPPSLIRPVIEGGKATRAWDIDGRAHVNDVNAQLDLKGSNALPERDDYDTLAGFIIATLGRIPKTGEKLTPVPGMTIIVTQAEPRRIDRVRVELTTPPATPPA